MPANRSGWTHDRAIREIGNRRGVAGQDRLVAEHAGKSLENAGLDRLVLGDGLDHHVAIGQRRRAGGRAQERGNPGRLGGIRLPGRALAPAGRKLPGAPEPESSMSWFTSTMVVETPERIRVAAIPAPIWPAPEHPRAKGHRLHVSSTPLGTGRPRPEDPTVQVWGVKRMISTRRGGSCARGGSCRRRTWVPKPTAATLRDRNQPAESIPCLSTRYLRTESACSWVRTSARSTSWSSLVKAAMTTSDCGWLACLHQRPTSSRRVRPTGSQDGAARFEQFLVPEQAAVSPRARLVQDLLAFEEGASSRE